MSVSILNDEKGKILNLQNDPNDDDFSANLTRADSYPQDKDDLGVSFLSGDHDHDHDHEQYNDEEKSDTYSEKQVSEPYSFGSEIRQDPYIEAANFEHEQGLRATYLIQLKNLYKRGYVSDRRFGPEDSSDVLKCEVLRLKKEKSIESGVNYCKQGLVFFANTLELANRNLLGNIAHLDGFGGHTLKTQEDYNEVFEELYLKYGNSLEMGPEVKFLMIFASSVFMFHLSNTMAIPKTSSAPAGMSGPSKESEELLKKLSAGDLSDLSSVESDSEVIKVKTKKKRSKK